MTNARRMLSLAAAISAGSPPSGSTRPSGIGWTHASPGRIAPVNASGVDDGPKSIGRARRSRPRSWSRHTFVAIRYSHDRSVLRPSNESTFFQARTIVSWTASSASKTEPSIR